MPNIKLEVLPFPDLKFVALVDEFLAKDFPQADPPGTLTYQIGSQSTEVSVPFQEFRSTETYKKILPPDREVFRRAKFRLQLTQDIWVEVGLDRKEDGVTEITLEYSEQFFARKNSNALEVIVRFHDFIAPYRRSQLLKSIDPLFTKLVEDRAASLNKIENVHLRILEEFTATRKQMELENAAIREKNLKEVQEARAHSEAILQAREAELKTREESIEKRQAELDDRTNRHARRQIYEDLKKTLQSRNQSFKLTKDTARKRWVAYGAFAGLIGLFAFLAVTAFTTSSLSVNGLRGWLPLAKFTTSIIALGASIYSFIRWQDRWVASHAQEEFRIRRMELDIDRASWLVELMLEWGVVRGDQMPAELLDRLSFGLFQTGGQEQAGRLHPAEDALAALLGNSTNVQIESPMIKASLDRKGLKQANEELKG